MKQKSFNNKLLVSVFSLFILLFMACSNSSDSDNKQESSSESGNEEEITIRLGQPDAEIDEKETPYYGYTETFRSIVEEKSNGRIKIEVFPDSQLGNLQSMMEQTARGDLEMTAGQNGGYLSTYDPNVQVLDIPFIFSSLDTAREVLAGSFGEELTEKIAQESGLRIVSYLPSAFRDFANNVRPIQTPEDMKGLNMRIMESPIHEEMIKALGANPTTIAFEELYTALQTGVVDGQDNAAYVVLMGNLQEVQKYYSLNHHMLNNAVVMINDEFFQGLSEEDQQIILEAADEAQQGFLNTIDERTEEDLKRMEEAGVEITELTDEQFEEFREVVQPPVMEYLEDEIDQEWVEKLFKAIEEVEN